MKKTAIPALACLSLAACGGYDETLEYESGGDPPPPAQVVNSPPVVQGDPPDGTAVGVSWHFVPEAADPDADPLQYSVENAPPWATFDPATGLLIGTPDEGDVGNWEDVRVSVSDGINTVTLPAFDIVVAANGAATGTATLSWTPPTERSDGSPIGELAGYRVLYGPSSRYYVFEAKLDNPGLTRYVVETLGKGHWYFAITAVAADGLESVPSEEVSKRIGGG